MPEVVNRHHFKGRSLPAPYLYVGRGTPLGNPYTKAEHGEDALRLYAVHLWGKVQDRIVRQFLDVAGADLRCYGTTKDGAPRHPLYLPYSAGLRPLEVS